MGDAGRPGDVLPGAQFTPADLQTMPAKSLRMLCIQYGVLPRGSVDRSDLLEALMPVASGSERQADVGTSDAKRMRTC